jgi:hypothetical protein
MATIGAIGGANLSGARAVQPRGLSRGEGPRFEELMSRTNPASGSARAPAGAQESGGVLDGLEEGRRRLDGLIRQAQAGRTFSPRELLALQSEVYRLTEDLMLAQRVVEEGLGGLKRVWSMQI